MSSYNPLLLELQLAHKTTSMYLMKPSTSAMGADLSGTVKWYGGVLGPDGKIYMESHAIPHLFCKFLRYQTRLVYRKTFY